MAIETVAIETVENQVVHPSGRDVVTASAVAGRRQQMVGQTVWFKPLVHRGVRVTSGETRNRYFYVDVVLLHYYEQNVHFDISIWHHCTRKGKWCVQAKRRSCDWAVVTLLVTQ